MAREDVMPWGRHLSRGEIRDAAVDCGVLAAACLITYWLATRILAHVYLLSRDDELIGGLWAVIATIFVLRDSYRHSVSAAVTRMAATAVSFVLCLIYLIFLPFDIWAMAALIGLSALAVTLIGRPGDALTAAITTAVIMGVAALSPHDAWRQPIMRFADTVIGVAVGVATAWVSLRMLRPERRPNARSSPARTPLARTPLPRRPVIRRPVIRRH
jgi:Fusaric acid resistance protein-like